MKKLYLSLPLILLVGCATNNSTIKPFSSVSIAQQKIDAQNAWDELDGKIVSNKIYTKKQTNHYQKYQKPIQSQNINKIIKSTLKTSDSIPNWFYSPPKSNKYFYGAGEGDNAIQAKNNALNFIAGEIQTSISSTFNQNEGYFSAQQSSSYKNISQDIQTKVEQIKFTNIEIMQTIKVQNKLYILVRIDKNKLFNSLKVKFQTLNSYIDNQISISKKYSILEQLITLNKLTSKIKQAKNQLNILNVLNPNFNIKPYINKYNNYLSYKIALLHQISFSVVPNDIFGQKLTEVLNNQNYKISKHSKIRIRLKENIRKSKPFGMAVIRATINIKVLSNNNILKSTSIETKGVSNTYSQALTKATINFKQKLQSIGINKLLGFE